jgi:hypothetical protein
VGREMIDVTGDSLHSSGGRLQAVPWLVMPATVVTVVTVVNRINLKYRKYNSHDSFISNEGCQSNDRTQGRRNYSRAHESRPSAPCNQNKTHAHNICSGSARQRHATKKDLPLEHAKVSLTIQTLRYGRIRDPGQLETFLNRQHIIETVLQRLLLVDVLLQQLPQLRDCCLPHLELGQLLFQHLSRELSVTKRTRTFLSAFHFSFSARNKRSSSAISFNMNAGRERQLTDAPPVEEMMASRA